MRHAIHRLFAGILLAWALAAAAAVAEPVAYRLDREASRVAFDYDLAGQPARGRMPVREAEVLLDLDRPSNSRVRAVIDAAGATAGLFLATEAMRSTSVLDTARHPVIEFRSTAVRGTPAAARIDGDLTIRGVTRPVTLDAQVLRLRDSAPGTRDRLAIRMTGTISRAAFGAGGYADLVGDTVTLDILTWIDRVR